MSLRIWEAEHAHGLHLHSTLVTPIMSSIAEPVANYKQMQSSIGRCLVPALLVSQYHINQPFKRKPIKLAMALSPAAVMNDAQTTPFPSGSLVPLPQQGPATKSTLRPGWPRSKVSAYGLVQGEPLRSKLHLGIICSNEVGASISANKVGAVGLEDLDDFGISYPNLSYPKKITYSQQGLFQASR